MKKLMILGMLGVLGLSYGCNRDSDVQDIQREEEMNRGDMIEDSTYEQRDINRGMVTPSNTDLGTPSDDLDASGVSR